MTADGSPHAPAAPANTATGAARRISAGFLLRHAAHFVAMGAGSGLSRVAPGTVGTLWAWASYLALSLWLTPLGWGVVIAVSFFVGWWACTVTARHAGVSDPGFVVWDEIVAFWIVLWLVTPATVWQQLAAFILFRYFDAAKPGPVRWADRRFKGDGWRGGFGILFDDLVAALCTLVVIAIAKKLWQWW